LLAAADPPAAADLLVADLLAADLVAAADGAGLPDDALEADAKAAVGTAIAVAAMTAATARRRLRTDMTLSFADRMSTSPAVPPKTDHPATLKKPRNRNLGQIPVGDLHLATAPPLPSAPER